MIIIVACGERANEVVEIFAEFPELVDPHTGHKLMERTIIICNTSNMPVAAREASVYTGMTIGEYYRSMGLKVLVMADSTSRWAQALREMSNRLEELPGQDAFPMDLSAIISNFYARAGLVKLHNGHTGSVTFLGTVSPAGGNLKEPVTESTKKAARCFYALSQGRADSKRYPAIDPLDSYSKYLEYPEIRAYLDDHIEKDWVDLVYAGKTIVQRGKEANDQINILGDDGVPVEYHERFLEIGADRLRDFAAGCVRCHRCQLPDGTPADDVQDGARNLPPRFRIRRFRGLLAVLQGSHQPLPSDELLGVAVGEVRELPQADRTVCE